MLCLCCAAAKFLFSPVFYYSLMLRKSPNLLIANISGYPVLRMHVCMYVLCVHMYVRMYICMYYIRTYAYYACSPVCTDDPGLRPWSIGTVLPPQHTWTGCANVTNTYHIYLPYIPTVYTYRICTYNVIRICSFPLNFIFTDFADKLSFAWIYSQIFGWLHSALTVLISQLVRCEIWSTIFNHAVDLQYIHMYILQTCATHTIFIVTRNQLYQ